MNKKDRPAVFKQALDYITGRSNINSQWPRWSMADIRAFWSLQWKDEEDEQNSRGWEADAP